MRKRTMSLTPTSVIIFCPDGRILCRKIPKDGARDGRYYIKPIHIIYIEKFTDDETAEKDILNELNLIYKNIYPNNSDSYILQKTTAGVRPEGRDIYYLKFKEKMLLEVVGNIDISLIDFNKLATRIKETCKYGVYKKVIYGHCEVDNVKEMVYFINNLKNLKRGSDGT